MSRFSKALYASLMVDVASLPIVYAEDPIEGDRIRTAVERELRTLPTGTPDRLSGVIPGDPTTYPDRSQWLEEQFLAELRRHHEADPARALRCRQARIAELVEMSACHARPAPSSAPDLAAAIVETLRAALQATDELPPSEADLVYSAIVSHVRARRPASVSPLGTLPPCTTPIVDPRSKP